MTPKARLELITFVQKRVNAITDSLDEAFEGGEYALGGDLAYLYAAIAAGTAKGFEVDEYANDCSLYNMLTYCDEESDIHPVPLDHAVWHYISILDPRVPQPTPPQHTCSCGRPKEPT
jgi:hypothetical protein